MHASLLDIGESCYKMRTANLMLAPSPLKLGHVAWAGCCLSPEYMPLLQMLHKQVPGLSKSDLMLQRHMLCHQL